MQLCIWQEVIPRSVGARLLFKLIHFILHVFPSKKHPPDCGGRKLTKLALVRGDIGYIRAAHGFMCLAAQGFLLAHGFICFAAHGFLAAQGFFAPQGLPISDAMLGL